MTVHTRIFGSQLPTANTDIVGRMVSVDGSDGENISNFEDDIKERLTLDHYMADNLSVTGDQDGRHKQVMMKESSSAPTALENTGILYTKDDSGDTELYYKDDLTSGNETQITKDGEIANISGPKSFAELFTEFAKVELGRSTGFGTGENYTSVSINTQSPAGVYLYRTTYTIDYPDGYSYNNCMFLFGSTVGSEYTYGTTTIQCYSPLGQAVLSETATYSSPYPAYYSSDIKLKSSGIQVVLYLYSDERGGANPPDWVQRSNYLNFLVLGKLA